MKDNREREKFYKTMNSVMTFYKYVGLGVILFIVISFFVWVLTGCK